jgi:hypothetical protein
VKPISYKADAITKTKIIAQNQETSIIHEYDNPTKMEEKVLSKLVDLRYTLKNSESQKND